MAPGRKNLEESRERMAYCAEMMIRLRDTKKVCDAMTRKYGIGYSAGLDWMTRVRKQWRQEAEGRDVDDYRNDARATMNQVLAIALSKTSVVKGKDGNPVIDPQTGQPIVRATPDLTHTIQAQRVLMDLDGLARPVQQAIKVDAEVSSVDLRALTDRGLQGVGEV